MELYGWAGKILRVDLSKETFKTQPLPTDMMTSLIGGRGFNSKILYDEVAPGTDPLGPDNKLIFGTGPVTGTIVSASGRFTVTAKSPTTDAFGDANAGGHWGGELKWAGYDVIVFEGAAKKPVFLWIDDDQIELRNAEHIWGLDYFKTTEEVQKDVGDMDISVAGIGPAGERLVYTSCVMNEYTRAAAKCGMGAVMGSKRLKAIAVRGTKGVKVAKPGELFKIVEEYIEILKREDRWFYENFSKYGTPMFVDQYQQLGALPTRNWRETCFEEAEKVGVGPFYKKYVKKKRACQSCPYHCSPYFTIDEGRFAGTWDDGTEYEATGGFSSKVGCGDLEVALVGGAWCDKFGLDYINCADTIAWAFECYNKGILTKEDTDGLDLKWGNADAVLECIRRMAYKEGKFGELLALGSRKAGRKVGKGAEYYSITIKGQQMGMMDPRVFHAWGFAYGVSTRGGDHLRSHAVCEYMFTPEEMEKYVGSRKAADRFGFEGKGKLIFWTENIRALNDSIENCKYFFRGSPRLWTEYPHKVLSAVTGLDWTYEMTFAAGQRINLIERAYNAREGLGRKDDYLPERFYKEPVPTGPTKGASFPREQYDKILDEYYEMRGVDKKTGYPKKEKLLELGLADIAADLEKRHKLG